MHDSNVFTFCLCRRHANGDLLKRTYRRRDCVPDRCYEGLGGPSGALARGVEGEGRGQTQHGGRGGQSQPHPGTSSGRLRNEGDRMKIEYIDKFTYNLSIKFTL